MLYKKVEWPRKLPCPWTITWSKQFLSAVHPATCSLLWVTCLFNQLSISDFLVPASGLWSGSGSKIDQFVHVLWTCKISFKCMHTFLSNLVNRETDKHRGQSHLLPPLSEVKIICLVRRNYALVVFACCQILLS